MSDPDKFTAEAEAEKLREHVEDMQLAERIGAVEMTQTKKVEARSYWGSVWRRLRRDKLALTGGVTILVIFLAAFIGAPIAEHILGHGPNDLFTYGTDENLLPVGPLTHVEKNDGSGTTMFLLGADSNIGRDLFLRLLYGARVSFEVAVLATIIGVTVGTLLGSAAGYFRGSVDTVVSRLTEIAMAFPFLLFAIAIAATAGDKLRQITLNGVFPPGVVGLLLVISLFSWFYPARIMRGIVLSLREKEFIEAARMTGAGDWRIIRSHLLPHLVAPIIVYSTLIVAANILAEAGLSFLGVGIPLPTASWGTCSPRRPTTTRRSRG